jgi:replicative DNA helicase
MDINLGKIPPQCIEIEESLLADIIAFSDLLDEAVDLKVEYFYKDAHQKIFSAILELNSRNLPIDLMTVCDQMSKTNTLDEVGGRYFLTQLMSVGAVYHNIPFFVALIKEKAFKREMIRVGMEIVNKAYDDLVDVEDLMSESVNMVDAASNIVSTESDRDLSFPKLLKKASDQAQQREILRKKGEVLGIKTPLKKLDQFTGGWRGGDLITIGARPSTGKTALAVAIAKEDARCGGHPNFYSLETIDVKIADRIFAGEADVSYDNYTMGLLTPGEWVKLSNAEYNLSKMDIIIDDGFVASIDTIKSRSRKLKKQGRCTMIIIDYLQLVKENIKGGNREQEISTISRKCKQMAKELNVPVFILAQLNRKVEDRQSRRPQMSDIRESGSAEQDSDLVILPYRPAQYGILEDENGNSTVGRGILILAKNKEGDTGDIDFGHNKSLTRIFDVDDDPLPIISKEKAHPDTNTAPGYSIESNRDLESNEDF